MSVLHSLVIYLIFQQPQFVELGYHFLNVRFDYFSRRVEFTNQRIGNLSLCITRGESCPYDPGRRIKLMNLLSIAVEDDQIAVNLFYR